MQHQPPLSPRCSEAPWDTEVTSGLQAEVDRWRGKYEELFSKLTPTQVRTGQDRTGKDVFKTIPAMHCSVNESSFITVMDTMYCIAHTEIDAMESNVSGQSSLTLTPSIK